MKYNAKSSAKRFFDPIAITIVSWLFVITGSMILDVNSLEISYLLFLILGIASYVLGMFIFRLFKIGNTVSLDSFPLGHRNATKFFESYTRLSNRITLVLLAMEFIALLYFIAKYSNLASNFDVEYFRGLRNIYLDEVSGESSKFFMYTTHFTIFGITTIFFAVRTYYYSSSYGLQSSKLIIYLVILNTLLMSILTTGRTAPLLVIISCVFYFSRFQIVPLKKIIFWALFIFIFIFIFIAFLLGKEGLNSGDVIVNNDSLLQLIKVYFFSAPAAMQEVFLNQTVVSSFHCTNLFSYPAEIAIKFGFLSECGQKKLDFVFVPMPTNVYTFLRAYWEDFGWGYLIGLFLTGFIVEFFYFKAYLRDAYAAYIFPFFLNGIFLQVFEEQLFVNGSIFFYFTLFYFLCNFLYNRKVIFKSI